MCHRLKAMATSMKDLVGDPLDDFAKKFTLEFIELGIRPGDLQISPVALVGIPGNSKEHMDELKGYHQFRKQNGTTWNATYW